MSLRDGGQQKLNNIAQETKNTEAIINEIVNNKTIIKHSLTDADIFMYISKRIQNS